ncbi:MAG: hypothetical protein WCG76_04975 [Verrucomicrobiota bacterium]
MKIRILLPLLAVCAGTLCAQSPQSGSRQNSALPPGQGEQMKERFRDKMMDNLPPEIRARFEAAREKAMQDPTVQELKKKADTANGDFRKAMREAITKADPGLADILKEHMKDKMKDGKRGEPPGFANLSESDRQKLKAAHEKAKSDPAVVAAETLKQNAKTPEERQAAMEQFHKAMKAALLNADPTLGPILDQMKPPQGPPRGTDSKPGA